METEQQSMHAGTGRGLSLHRKSGIFKTIVVRMAGKSGRMARFAVLAALSAMFLFPLVYTIANSFMSDSEIYDHYAALSGTASGLSAGDSPFVTMQWIPQWVTLSQYYAVLIEKPQFLLMFWNSVKLTLPIIAGQLAVSLLAGYAFSHLRFRFREPLFFLYIVTMLMPFQVTLVPNYIMAGKLGLLGTYGAIVYPGIFGALGVFLIRQFMMFIPRSYMEAAKVDGAGHLYIFAKIVLPLCKAGTAALAILLFIDNWNMVEQPLIFLHDAIKQPLSVYLSTIDSGDIGIAFAASVLYMSPLLLAALLAEDDLVEGIQLSGIKG